MAEQLPRHFIPDLETFLDQDGEEGALYHYALVGEGRICGKILAVDLVTYANLRFFGDEPGALLELHFLRAHGYPFAREQIDDFFFHHFAECDPCYGFYQVELTENHMLEDEYSYLSTILYRYQIDEGTG